jgi:NADH-ubiquinone oxidoreductase chain 3
MRNLIQTYQEKYSIFECGFHSFLGQNRTQFGIKFFIFGLVFLLLDLEILLIFPFPLSLNVNDIYGLSLALIFILIITIGFVFELGKGALNIYSRQVNTSSNEKSSYVIEQVANFNLEDKVINNINQDTLPFMNEDIVNLNKKKPLAFFSDEVGMQKKTKRRP